MRESENPEVRERGEEVRYAAGEPVPFEAEKGQVLEPADAGWHCASEEVATEFELSQPSQLGDRTRYWPAEPVTLKTQRIELGQVSDISAKRARKLVVFDVNEQEFRHPKKKSRKRTRDVSEVLQVNSIQVLHFHQRRRDCTGQKAILFTRLAREGETRDPVSRQAGDTWPFAAVRAGLPVLKHAGGVMGDGRFEGEETRFVVHMAGSGGGGEALEGEEREEREEEEKERAFQS